MGQGNADLEYVINTVADRKALEAYRESLKQQSDAIKAIGGDASDYERRLAAVDASLKQTTQATEGLSDSKHRLIQNLKALRHEHIPGLSQALHLLRHPITALAVVVGFAVDVFRKLSEAVEQAAAAAEPFENITASFGKFRSVTEESRAGAAAFAAELAKIAAEADTAETRFKALTQRIDEEAKSTEALRKARLGLATAQVELLAAEGKISESEKSRRLAGIKELTGTGDRQATIQTESAKHFALVGRISQTENQKALAEQAIPAAQENVEAAQKKAAADKKLAGLHVQSAEVEIEKLKKDREHLRGLDGVEGGFYDVPTNRWYSGQGAVNARIGEISQDIQQQIENKSSAEAIIKKADSDIGAATKALDDLRQKVLQYTKSLQELQAERQTSLLRSDLTASHGPVLAGIEHATIQTTEQSAQITLGKKTIEERNQTLGEIGVRQSRGQPLGDLINKLKQENRTLLDVLAAVSGHSEDTLKILKNFEERLRAFKLRYDSDH
jgi:chromosome segregation ATPase